MSENYEQKNEKLKEWIGLYKNTLRQVGVDKHVDYAEGYKFYSVDHFQRNFNLQSKDLALNIEESLVNNNLVVGAMYYPRKMLIIYAQEYPSETKELLTNLFDESVEVQKRINDTEKGFNELEARRRPDVNKRANTFINLRFISLLLGFMYPDKHNALKPAEWKVFCRYINPEFKIPNHTPPGDQYVMYLDYIEPLIRMVKNDPFIDEVRGKMSEGMGFKDTEFRWIAQDVIYTSSRQYAQNKSKEQALEPLKEVIPQNKKQDQDITVTQTEDMQDTGFMAFESHLEEYVVRNWSNIDFGEELHLYIDQEGTTGQQYTTDVGIIDILAKDKDDNFVIIELKKAEYGYKVVGQLLNYIGWVQDNLSDEKQSVRGIIIVGQADKTLISSVKPVANIVKLMEYRVSLFVSEVK